MSGFPRSSAEARLLLRKEAGGGGVQVLAEVAALVSGVAVGVASGRLVLEGILTAVFGRRS